MKSWKWMAVLMLGAALAAAAGCGGDDDDDDKPSNTAGKGGSAGTGEEPDMMQLPEGAVACGNQVCMPQEGVNITLCCADPFSATCGMMQGQACMKRTEVDPRCPSISVAGGMFMLASCCTDDNMCGIDTSVFTGDPCTELGAAKERAMMMGGMASFIMFPDPKPCE